jgi:acyl carrier protein
MNDQQAASFEQRVPILLAEAFQVPQAEITPELAFGDLPQWDSMGHMELMMLLEERFGIEISTETIAQLVSVPAIIQYLAYHAKERDHGES